MSLISGVFLGLGCVLDYGFPAYTQVSHVSNILCYAVLQSGQMCSGRSPSSTAVPHQLCCVLFFQEEILRVCEILRLQD